MVGMMAMGFEMFSEYFSVEVNQCAAVLEFYEEARVRFLYFLNGSSSKKTWNHGSCC